jgi:hypothetical protein
VTCRGPGVERAGETTVLVEAGGTVQATITLRPRPPAPPTVTWKAMTVTLAGNRGGIEQGETYFHDADEEAGWTEYGVGGQLVLESTGPVLSLGAVEAPDRVAPAAPVDRGSGTVSLRFVRGGYLAVLPATWGAPELGSRRVRAAHGGLVFVSASSEDGPEFRGAIREARVGSGLLLGPLVPGVHGFEVLVGPTVVGRVEATVRPGRIELLRVP